MNYRSFILFTHIKEKDNRKWKTHFALRTLELLLSQEGPFTFCLSLVPFQLEPWLSFYFLFHSFSCSCIARTYGRGHSILAEGAPMVATRRPERWAGQRRPRPRAWVTMARLATARRGMAARGDGRKRGHGGGAVHGSSRLGETRRGHAGNRG